MKKFLGAVATVFVVLFTIFEFFDNWFEFANYGEQMDFNATELYYVDVDTTVVKALGNYLVESEFANGIEKSVQISKVGEDYVFKGVFIQETWQDSAYLDSGYDYAKELSLYVFDSSPVQFHLCNDEFESQNSVRFDIDEFPYGWEMKFGPINLFFTKRTKQEMANKLGEYLVRTEFTDSPASVQLDRSDSAHHFKMISIESVWNDESWDPVFQDYARELSDSVFNAQKVVFHITDDDFTTQKHFVSN